MNPTGARFMYRTRIRDATYRVLLTMTAVRVDVVLRAPYAMTCAAHYCNPSGGIDHTKLLRETAGALQPLSSHDLEWRVCAIVSHQGAFISAYADITLEHLTPATAKQLRAALPQGSQTRVRYDP